MPIEGYTTFSCQDVKWLLREDIPITVKGKVISDLSSSSFFEQNTPIKKGNRKSIWLLSLSGGETYIIKRYETRHLLAYIKNLIVASKAARELKAATTIAQNFHLHQWGLGLRKQPGPPLYRTITAGPDSGSDLAACRGAIGVECQTRQGAGHPGRGSVWPGRGADRPVV